MSTICFYLSLFLLPLFICNSFLLISFYSFFIHSVRQTALKEKLGCLSDALENHSSQESEGSGSSDNEWKYYYKRSLENYFHVNTSGDSKKRKGYEDVASGTFAVWRVVSSDLIASLSCSRLVWLFSLRVRSSLSRVADWGSGYRFCARLSAAAAAAAANSWARPARSRCLRRISSRRETTILWRLCRSAMYIVQYVVSKDCCLSISWTASPYLPDEGGQRRHYWRTETTYQHHRLSQRCFLLCYK